MVLHQGDADVLPIKERKMANFITPRTSRYCCTFHLLVIVSVMIASPAMGQIIDVSQVNDQLTTKPPLVSDVVFKRSSSDVLKTFFIQEGTRNIRIDTDEGTGSVAGVSETLIYSSLLGKVIAQVPPFQLVADDLFVNAAPGCALRRFTFQTIGIANPIRCGRRLFDYVCTL